MTAQSDRERVDNIAATLEATTPGTWEAYNPGDGTARLYALNEANEDESERLAACPECGHSGALTREDGEFVANAHNGDVAFLIRLARRQATIIAAVNELAWPDRYFPAGGADTVTRYDLRRALTAHLERPARDTADTDNIVDTDNNVDVKAVNNAA